VVLCYGFPQLVEERVAHVQAIQNALGPQVAIGENRRRPVGVDNRPPLPLDLVTGLLPGKTCKLSAALGARPLQRVQRPLGAVHTVRIVIDLDTQSAARERVLRVAAYVNGAPVLDGDQHGAGVRTIVRTRPNDRGGVLGVSANHMSLLTSVLISVFSAHASETSVRACVSLAQHANA